MSINLFYMREKPRLIWDSNPGALGIKSAMLPTVPLRSSWNMTRLGFKVVSLRELFFEGVLETHPKNNVKGSQSFPT
jgi:hypothetical protein